MLMIYRRSKFHVHMTWANHIRHDQFTVGHFDPYGIANAARLLSHPFSRDLEGLTYQPDRHAIAYFDDGCLPQSV